MKGAGSTSRAGLRNLPEIVLEEDKNAGWPTSFDPTGGTQRLLTSSPVLGIHIPSAHPSHSWSHFQRHSLESNVLLKRLDWLVTEPIKTSYQLLRFWQMGADIYLFCCRQALYVFSCLLNLPPSNLEWPLSLVSPCPLCTGDSFRFHLGSFQGFKPTKLPSRMTKKALYQGYLTKALP